MDSDVSTEGAYDAPVDHIPSGNGLNDQPDANQLAAERQQRIERVRQRRTEMAQSPSSVSSALTKTSAPSPISIPATTTAAASSPAAGLRADLIADAVLFLTNPKVVSAPLETKRKFLTQRKGMTEAEVDEAVRRSTSGSVATGSASNTAVAAPSAAAGPNYYPPQVVYAQPPMPLAPHLPPPPPSPSLKAIALIVVLCVGVGGALYSLFKRYILSYWFPKRNPLTEKVETLEVQLKAAHEQISTQASDTKEAIRVIRTFLEDQVKDWSERQKLEDLRQTQDEQKLTELKREVSSVRHLLPSVGNFGRAVKQSALQTDAMEEIRNELSSLKNAIKGFVSGERGSLTLSRAASQATPAPTPTTNNTTTDATSSSNPSNTTPSAEATPTTSSVPPTSTTSTNLTSSQSGSLSNSRRAPPAWMTAQSGTLPAWQLSGKSAENAAASTNTSTTNTDTTSTESSAPLQSSAVDEEASSAPSKPVESAPQSTVTASVLADPPYSASYQDILRMVKQGIVPPNVKTDVDDTPRDPTAPLQAGSLIKRNKPWQNSENTAQPLPFKVEEVEDDEDLPKEIGPSTAESDGEDLVLSDIELPDH